MQNKRFNRNIFGDLSTQKQAQKALPILVSYAQEGGDDHPTGISCGDSARFDSFQLEYAVDSWLDPNNSL